jgi:lipoprotein antigen
VVTTQNSWKPAIRTVLAAGLAVALSGCAIGARPAWSPSPVVVTTPSAPSAAPVDSPTTPSATPTKAPVKGTGSLKFFMDVGSDFVTTCQRVDDAPTLVMTDLKNEFFTAVEITTTLNAAGTAVAAIDGTMGEDAEGNQWIMAYKAAPLIKGTSATLKASGSTYTIRGTAMMYVGEDKSRQLTPFTMVVRCGSRDW